MVLAHVTNKLSSHVTHMTVQVFKDDWIRSSSTSKLNIPSLSTSNNMTYSNQGTPSTKAYSAPHPLNAPTGTKGNTKLNISSPRKASWLQNNNRVFIWGRRPDVSSGRLPFHVRYFERFFFFYYSIIYFSYGTTKHSRPALSEVCPLLYKTVENPDNNKPFSCNSTILKSFWLFICTTAHSELISRLHNKNQGKCEVTQLIFQECVTSHWVTRLPHTRVYSVSTLYLFGQNITVVLSP